MLLTIDAARQPILIAGDSRAFCGGEVAVAFHSASFTPDVALLPLEPGGLSRCQLAAANALRDARLLPVMTMPDHR